jgi:cytochrome c oxidase subunit 2
LCAATSALTRVSLAGSGAVLLGGCADVQSILSPAGPAARALANLGWFVLGVLAAVAVVTTVLIVWAAVRRQGSLADHAAPDTGGGLAWVHIGGFLIPIVVLAVVFVLSLTTMAKFPLTATGDGPSEIRVIGHQWWWEVQYLLGPRDQVTTANEIHIPVGRAMTIELRTHDVIHSFWVPRLHGKVDLVPGQVNRVRLQADHEGVYRGQCAEFCGLQHAHMGLEIVAQPPEAFTAWLARQRAPAAEPTGLAAEGKTVFARSACVGCHRIAGVSDGKVGPDLTHFGSRRAIAAGMLPMTLENVAAWIENPAVLKPGAKMPALPLTKDETRALAGYLVSLK